MQLSRLILIQMYEYSVELMSELVASQDLCVIQTEFSLYVLLKLWLFLKLHPVWDGSPQEGITAAHQFFQGLAGENKVVKILFIVFHSHFMLWVISIIAESDVEFLLSPKGAPYEVAFKGLRLFSLIGHPQDVDMVQGDRILPAAMLLPVFRTQWYRMLRSDQGIDKG